MENRNSELRKHEDFVIIDIICLHLCFIISYWIHKGFFSNPYQIDTFQYQAVVLTISQFIVVIFSNNYRDILYRGQLNELKAVIKYIAMIMLITLTYFFAMKHSIAASRLQLGLMSVTFTALDYLFRTLNKARVFNSSKYKKNRRSVVLITSGDLAEATLDRLMNGVEHRSYFITAVIVTDRECAEDEKIGGIPVYSLNDETLSRLSHDWVDEAFLLQSNSMTFPAELMDSLVKMGMTVNYSSTALNDDRWPMSEMREFGSYRVLSGSYFKASAGELAVKRLMDIIGGLVGCMITAIAFIFVAPAIYIKSPGPIFFKQTRVGMNGRPFVIYKFRSMYLDAEERKAELLKKNSLSNDQMFKIFDDPRIIGSEKRDKNGRPRGVGTFIRKHSIDELPQFFNVLKGDMSIVGSRPPSFGEWEKYDLAHRVRMTIKPGLTGLWQVSGRSSITDFDEVVRLDREYIETWSLLLDAKIIFKTVSVVFKGDGAV